MIDQSVKSAEVVIIGGGFGGLEVAKGLRDSPVRIFLADRRNYHLFQPLLYQVATSVLSGEKIAAPIRHVLKTQDNVTVALAEITGIDLENRIIYGKRAGRHYDYLVIAAGLEQSYFGHDEFRAHAPGLKTLDDAAEIRRRILGACVGRRDLDIVQEERLYNLRSRDADLLEDLRDGRRKLALQARRI